MATKNKINLKNHFLIKGILNKGNIFMMNMQIIQMNNGKMLCSQMNPK